MVVGRVTLQRAPRTLAQTVPMVPTRGVSAMTRRPLLNLRLARITSKCVFTATRTVEIVSSTLSFKEIPCPTGAGKPQLYLMLLLIKPLTLE